MQKKVDSRVKNGVAKKQQPRVMNVMRWRADGCAHIRVRAHNRDVGIYDANDGKAGVVYILANDALRDDVFKIGQSTRSGKARADELNAEGKTGMPKRYRCIFEVTTDDCGRAEKNVHRRLLNRRMSKEFFRVDMEEAKRIVREECARFRVAEAREYERVPFTGWNFKHKRKIADEVGSSLIASMLLTSLPLAATTPGWAIGSGIYLGVFAVVMWVHARSSTSDAQDCARGHAP